jgi:DNA-binding transcriptional ArsR family regulator
MTEPERNGKVILARGRPNGNFCWQQNEIYDLFQKIVGPTALAVYANLTRKAYGGDPNLKCTLRELAAYMGQSRATVGRELKVLEHLGVIRLKVSGGSRPTAFELTNLTELGRGWGAIYDKRTSSFELPRQSTECLMAQVDQLRRELQGKAGRVRSAILSPSISAPTSERDTIVPPERHQCHTGETQTGSHPLMENRRRENNHPLPLSKLGNRGKTKTFPIKERPRCL